MVKRKYLAISLIILCSAVCLPTSYAGAYLPEPGHYKYSTSFLFLDRMSQKKRDYLASTFAKIHERIHELRVAKEEIIKIAAEHNIILTDLERHNIYSIELDIAELEEGSKEISTFKDDTMSYFEIEYGINDNQSLGLKYASGEPASIQSLSN